MSGEVQTKTSVLAEVARHVDNAGQILANIRGNVQQAVGSTTGGYNSPAATLFRQTMADWDGDFKAILDSLQNIHEKLTHNQKHYEATAETERQSANQIAALLNNKGTSIV